MADDLPEISLGYADDGEAAVYVDLTPVRRFIQPDDNNRI